MFLVFDRYNEVTQSFDTLEEATKLLLELRENKDRYDDFDVLLLEAKELDYEIETKVVIKTK